MSPENLEGQALLNYVQKRVETIRFDDEPDQATLRAAMHAALAAKYPNARSIELEALYDPYTCYTLATPSDPAPRSYLPVGSSLRPAQGDWCVQALVHIVDARGTDLGIQPHNYALGHGLFQQDRVVAQSRALNDLALFKADS